MVFDPLIPLVDNPEGPGDLLPILETATAPEPPALEDIREIYAASVAAMTARDARIDEMRDRFHGEYRGNANDQEYVRPIRLPLFAEAVQQQVAVLETADPIIRVISKSVEDSPEARTQLDRIRKWLYGVWYANSSMRAINLRHLLHLSQVLEGAAVLRITWQGDSYINPVIDVYPWRQCYMPYAVAGIPSMMITVTEMAVEELESIWRRPVEGVGKLDFVGKRRERVDQIDIWLMHEGYVWNGVYAGRNGSLLCAMKDMTVMDYPTIPFVVIPWMETNSQEPDKAFISPVWSYTDILDRIEEMVGKMTFITDYALNLPMVHKHNTMLGSATTDIRFGPINVVSLNEGESLEFPTLPVQPMPQNTLNILMAMASRMHLPPASGPYMSGAAAATQAAIGREILSIAAQSAAVGMGLAMRICLELARRHGEITMPVPLPPSLMNAAESATDVVIGIGPEDIPGDVYIHSEFRLNLPGDEMRRAQLATQMAAARSFSVYDILRATMPDEASEAYQRYLEQQTLPMILQAVLKEELQRAGYPTEGLAPQQEVGVPTPPGQAPAVLVGQNPTPFTEGENYGTEQNVGRPAE